MSLEQATCALREEGGLDPARKRALRARVLATPKKRPMRTLRWMLPMAAVLAGASVWASVARNRHEHAPPAATISPVQTTPNATTTMAIAIPSAPPPEPSTVETTPKPVAHSAATVAPTTPKHVDAIATSLPSPSHDDDGERRALRAYREAERLQFDEKDYARALDAWDRYLPLAGQSPLAVDARYQRALCLVRLGRSAEARAALEPFARGELGAYRQAEAQSLLSSLR